MRPYSYLRLWPYLLAIPFIYLGFTLWSAMRADFNEWELERAKLPRSPVRRTFTQDVDLKHRVVNIDGADYLVFQDATDTTIAVCPKVK